MALTIPSEWTQSSGCLPSGDLWGWAISEGKYADMFGGPTDTSSCYPPSYQPTSGVVYATDACPDGFTRACSTSTGDSSFTVCCPTAYPFSCGDPRTLDVATLLCRSRRPAETTSEWVTSSFTKFAPGLESVETYTATIKVRDSDTPSPLVVTTSGPIIASDIRGPGREILAMQVLITGTTSTTSSSATEEREQMSTSNSGTMPLATATGTSQDSNSSPSTSSSPAASSGGGLSTGAAAGIGAGVGAAALLLALGGWMLYRRGVARGRQSGTRSEQTKSTEYERIAPSQQPPYVYNHGAYHTHELEPTPPRPIELEPTAPGPRELE